MTKQEEIREGMRGNIIIAIKWAVSEGITDAYLDMHVDEMLKYLHSKGVVIKVKCPDCVWWQFKDGEAVGMTPCVSCMSTGYAVEPLKLDK